MVPWVSIELLAQSQRYYNAGLPVFLTLCWFYFSLCVLYWKVQDGGPTSPYPSLVFDVCYFVCFVVVFCCVCSFVN